MSKRLPGWFSAVVPVFLAVLAIFLMVPAGAGPSAAAADKPNELTLQAIFAEGGITGRAPETVRWSPDGTRLTFVQRDDSGDHGELWFVDAGTGEKKVLVSESKLASLAPDASQIRDERQKERVTRYHVAAYQWAPDGKHLLFDSLGQLWLYSLESGTAVQFTSTPEGSLDPKFSPAGDWVAYVSNHNLAVAASDGSARRSLTRDKDENILNGEVDWLYEEELEVRSNYFWSPNGREILFLRTDETAVPSYPITDWLPTHAKVAEEKYPQAGDPNPEVRLGVANRDSGKTEWVTLTRETDAYVPRFGWLRDGLVWAEVLNRTQDRMDLYFADPRQGKVKKVLSETSPEAWVNVNNDFRMLKSGDRFLWSSWRDGHTHLYLYNVDAKNPLNDEAKLERQLDRGDYEMLGLESVDEAAGTVYFTGNPDDPRQVQLYAIQLDGSGLRRVSREDGTHSVTFSDDGKHYADTFSSAGTPPRLSLCATNGSCKPVWESRDVAGYNLVPAKPLEFKAGDGTRLYGDLLLPDAPAGARVPLIVYIYGGPAGQTARNAWGGTTGLFHQRLRQHGYAVFTVDNRGTPGRGRAFSSAIRYQFGAVELNDQLTALDALLGQYPQLDPGRIAIWGWSNGGSMTLYALTHSDRFKAGVSVAPVTDWHNYDSAYTERYLGLPKDHPKAYEEWTPSKTAGNLHGGLLLAHGTGDDNVHVQNSVQMIEGLIQGGKQFQLMLYPNKTHGIAGATARVHLFQAIEDHFEKELR